MALEQKIVGELKELSDKLSRGETLNANTWRKCDRCEGVGRRWTRWAIMPVKCEACNGDGYVRVKCQLKAPKH